ncbi:hypothetical protein F894_01692 [Acinetobacter sp. CIP 51.11]|jgi:hypothetical protein|uniref:hypothetical protein n=2 Tax=Moraxellaceae TaxID=468 RepID=UPI0002CE3B2A|nr:hypothetical protein F894_01692 [Acinetobacter sp. CIP 51.11]MBK4748128.1 hypothetical protein [Acinetobacter baumannii]
MNFKIMAQIQIADFCGKYGFTAHQIRHAIRSGKLVRISDGIIDEEKALQILDGIKPKNSGLITLQNEIAELKVELQNTLDLKNYYEAELNKLGVFPPQIAKIPLSSKSSIQNHSDHPYLSPQWFKDQIHPIPESERMFKARKVQIPPEAFSSSLPDKK